ncbi:phosphoribosylformylglycinamidine cyclo-ligase [candidate division WOR-1 bacterium RIFOXYB2_FULL_42_35]|uniref:Phosphoribosylformylglycinamidine cyclo-ligase n=1 Tax=candidate division WOR-1 bacterium RIFOXYC2_FULL_41_25 TaxID=1802586 RepID=A0A1F4TRU1_UNCSA|nr:MAG: phosphoribosylformylglycinamidine cyclo-ligase [candidate division WOR-1 bacterium RIFOXYA2_FULL_41_14]OGC25217.1 MAG: phosphoribosylformylglycinamidine cyclo-ligase [candidate division WOR-1 bacterium RIFOXYB2_FULL_42_35]OGC34773.1 MAG: phosphoribosylformylglycinamidine cyclo-ligase [candidate division WOR-1 bacterium RIFOXYC2_FULL_41_25]OGC43756.1 MAG: phosphoribosylformylglycinamidine cyclo-ligase [candidate division WOR-1 bacterium RIFOXYD2_FULL_41_8]
MTYRQAGVDVAAGGEVVRRIRKFAKKIGFFGGFYPLGKDFLVGAADGVGTKLKVAFMMNSHTTVGIDLVAMNVNDVIAAGAKPIFFLDYIGCQRVRPPLVEKIIKGVAKGCKMAGCELLGGETAELSDMYQEGEYDLAGFCVGLVDKKKVINGSKIKIGDRLIGITSSGLHSNGYTLARKVLFEQHRFNPHDYDDDFGKSLGSELLTPTKIYVPTILNLIKRFDIKGIAHITGGGLPENVARVIPRKRQAVIDLYSWTVPPIFKMIQRLGKVDHNEMYKTFNMGIGMVIVVAAKDVDKVMKSLKQQKEKAYVIGEVGKGKGEVIII